MKRKLLILFSLLSLILGLSACGQKKEDNANKGPTLESFYSEKSHKEAKDAEFEELRKEYIDAYSEINYSVVENTFTYSYTFKQPCSDVEATKTSIETHLTYEIVGPIIEALVQESGIADIKVCYVYYDSDGTEICTKTFTRQEKQKQTEDTEEPEQEEQEESEQQEEPEQ